MRTSPHAALNPEPAARRTRRTRWSATAGCASCRQRRGQRHTARSAPPRCAHRLVRTPHACSRGAAHMQTRIAGALPVLRTRLARSRAERRCWSMSSSGSTWPSTGTGRRCPCSCLVRHPAGTPARLPVHRPHARLGQRARGVADARVCARGGAPLTPGASPQTAPPPTPGRERPATAAGVRPGLPSAAAGHAAGRQRRASVSWAARPLGRWVARAFSTHKPFVAPLPLHPPPHHRLHRTPDNPQALAVRAGCRAAAAAAGVAACRSSEHGSGAASAEARGAQQHVVAAEQPQPPSAAAASGAAGRAAKGYLWRGGGGRGGGGA